MKLVDTSSWIEYLRDAESEAGNRVEELVLTADAGWCDVTAVELWHGVRGAREKRDLAELEREVALFPVDKEAWQKARRLAVECREAGLTVPVADIIIVATAARHGIDLEHCDRHFDKILPIAARLGRRGRS
ncbi:MAG TPA: PIN domain-containing protein [Candidatus Paceibacterota bacterium]|nr:PIN domain-containing protein [Candidatus Paceibacterota bacterium]